MTNSNKPVKKEPQKDHELLTGVPNTAVAEHLIVQTACATFEKIEVEQEKLDKQINVTLGFLEGIGIRDQVEGILATQMISVHNLAMKFAANAQSETAGEKFLTENVNRASRLFQLFVNQLEALNRHRGKGQQKVTVEHININDGGQAIVGVVGETKKRGDGGR